MGVFSFIRFQRLLSKSAKNTNTDRSMKHLHSRLLKTERTCWILFLFFNKQWDGGQNLTLEQMEKEKQIRQKAHLKKKKTTGNMLNVYSLDLMCKVTQQLICTFGRMIWYAGQSDWNVFLPFNEQMGARDAECSE